MNSKDPSETGHQRMTSTYEMEKCRAGCVAFVYKRETFFRTSWKHDHLAVFGAGVRKPLKIVYVAISYPTPDAEKHKQLLVWVICYWLQRNNTKKTTNYSVYESLPWFSSVYHILFLLLFQEILRNFPSSILSITKNIYLRVWRIVEM